MTDARAADLLARRRRVSPSWLATYYDEPIELVAGEGRHVVDGAGTRYLDFFGGILTTMVGHAVPEVVEALRSQAGKLLHTSTLYLSEPLIALSERIAALSAIPDAKVFLVNSGTEANDVALQLACGLRRSNQVIALRGSYHGRSFATMGVTGIRAWSPQALTPLSVHYVHGGYRYRSPFGHLPDAEYTAACAADLRDVLETATSGDVACLIAEPVQGVGGFATPPDGFFTPMADIAREYGLLWISDEVQTGWGRTGEHLWGWQAHPGVAPDLVTVAKGLGNGLAIGAVIGRASVIDAVAGNSISTFGGNPLAAAGALANLDVLVRDDLQANALARGRQLRAQLDPVAEKFACVGEIRGKGLMVGVEMVVPGSRDAAPALAAAAMEATRRRGLLVGKGGLAGNVLRIAPPLSVTEAEVDEAAAIIVDALAEVDAA